MLPGRAAAGEPEIVRLAFDPEAIPEHPGAQLASYGTPLVDRLLADAVNRGRHIALYMVGLNLAPQGLEDRLRRAVTLPSGFELKLEQSRPLHFPQAVFWFEATFVSDQKEQDLLTVAIDVHHGRQVRHLDRLLDRAHLAEKPWSPLAEAPQPGLRTAYPIARDRVVRTLSALANTYHRELHERLDRQLERISRYYGDLRAEVEEQAQKARNREGDPAKFIARLESLTREEELQGAELRRKSQLKVNLRLLNLLVIHQPKLFYIRLWPRPARRRSSAGWSGCGIRWSRPSRPPSAPSAATRRSSSVSPARAGLSARRARPPQATTRPTRR